VDQESATKGKEPLRTLARFRRAGNKVLFGQNLIHDGTGTLRIGDPVQILRSR
jgi:MOSC domain-containing protein